MRGNYSVTPEDPRHSVQSGRKVATVAPAHSFTKQVEQERMMSLLRAAIAG